MAETDSDYTTPYDRGDDPGLEHVMHAMFEPAVPCSIMETRACVARWDIVEGEPTPIYASTVCPETCWRFRRPVEEDQDVAMAQSPLYILKTPGL